MLKKKKPFPGKETAIEKVKRVYYIGKSLKIFPDFIKMSTYCARR